MQTGPPETEINHLPLLGALNDLSLVFRGNVIDGGCVSCYNSVETLYGYGIRKTTCAMAKDRRGSPP